MTLMLGYSFEAVMIAICCVLSVIFFFGQRKIRPGAPPLYSGPWYMIFIGCGIEFGKEPLWYISRAKEKMGSVFTLYMTGKHLTFVTKPEDIDVFFNSKSVGFQKFVQDSVRNTSGVSASSFWQHHTRIHDELKGSLATGQLPPLCQPLANSLRRRMTHHQPGKIELNSYVRDVLYYAVMENLFGAGVLPTEDEKTFRELTSRFVLYDDMFEYGSQLGHLNHLLLRPWVSSKNYLLKIFRCVTPAELNKSTTDPTVFQRIAGLVDREHAPNYGLLLLWASLANAIPVTFWAIAYVLDTPGMLQRVQQAVDAIWQQCGSCPSPESFESQPLLRRCVLEAIRLRSPGIIGRGVESPLTIQSYEIPVGDMLVMSPYWAHRNPQLFPEPEKFNPDRWPDSGFLPGFVAFGGGRYMCPGRWFALLEIQMFLALFFKLYRVQALSEFPAHSPTHLVGVQQPLTDYNVQLTTSE